MAGGNEDSVQALSVLKGCVDSITSVSQFLFEIHQSRARLRHRRSNDGNAAFSSPDAATTCCKLFFLSYIASSSNFLTREKERDRENEMGLFLYCLRSICRYAI